MALSLYECSVPPFKQHLAALRAVLDKAVAHAQEKGIEPDALLMARLFPDMHPLKKQVTLACDFAKLCTGRLAGLTPPTHDDSETTFAQLQQRIAETVAVLDTASAEQMEGSEDKSFTIRAGQRELTFTGRDYLLRFALPNFYFHCTTTYAILRHNGVELGKMDYMRAR